MVKILKSFLTYASHIEFPTAINFNPGKEATQFVKIPAASKDKYKGPLSDEGGNGEIKPVEIGAVWYPEPPSRSSSTKPLVILHIHGGAFVIGSGRKTDAEYMARKYLSHTPATHVLFPQYRLASKPHNNRFPGPLQDSLTSYLYLINELGLSPKQIVIGGDSAGGNMAIAILRYLNEYGSAIGLTEQPLAGLLLSPWTNPSAGINKDFLKTIPNYKTDFIPGEFGSWGIRSYAGLPPRSPHVYNANAPHNAFITNPTHPYIKALGNPFKTDVPMWVTDGDAELLFGEGAKWVQEMQDAGNKVEFYIQSGAPHDILLLGNALGWDEEAKATAASAGAFLKALKT